MNPDAAEPLIQRFRLFSRTAAVMVIAVALLVWVGWIFDLEVLKKILPAWASMKTNTAIAFLFSGSSLLLQQDPFRPSLRRFGKLCAVVVLTIGALTLFEYLFRWNLGVDELFLKDPCRVDLLYPGRMAPMTALIFSLLGAALVLLGDRFATAHQALALALLFPSFAAVIGYLYSTQSLYKVGAYVSMAFHTAISFIILGFGILFARPASGFVARASADDLGGVMLRHLFPRMLLLLVVIGWFRLMGQRAGYYDCNFGLSIMVLSSSLVLGILVWQNAGVLSKVDRERLEANQELEQRVEQRTGELQVTGRAREKTIVELQQMQGASLNLMEDLAREVAEHKQAEQEIERKNRELEALLHVASHDLKEPLRAISNFSDILYERYQEQVDEKGRDYLLRIYRASARMTHLIDDLVALSQSRKFVPPQEFIEGALIVDEAIERLKPVIEKTKAKVKITGKLPRLRAEKTWATQAVYNLIGNALKFTNPGSSPEIEIAPYQPAAHEPPQAGIVVKDRGPGVTPEHRERIFELFQRAVGREVEGTGAGLAIVRSVAQRHGGTTWVMSREGGGSEFVVTFGVVEPSMKAR